MYRGKINVGFNNDPEQIRLLPLVYRPWAIGTEVVDMPGKKGSAKYKGVHDMYEGVHDRYSGVRDEYTGVRPTVAPGMRDFLEEEASPKEIANKDYTKVTTLSYDETH
ncbi:hypothetical protein Tfer_0495 [Thermincola ferriacetica]|uniref:Uncharacterized protein n=1 Tax=Thermincola ferriacetica TaxID=281456 RepID=A0A0L6W5R3_9FIRM|nr:hypothetical protein [Thermincola ferriacetica]KNZ70816.1 hypothetical protein Tfer_0495 [Thermincola ferriacetica]